MTHIQIAALVSVTTLTYAEQKYQIGAQIQSIAHLKRVIQRPFAIARNTPTATTPTATLKTNSVNACKKECRATCILTHAARANVDRTGFAWLGALWTVGMPKIVLMNTYAMMAIAHAHLILIVQDQSVEMEHASA